MFTTIQKLSWWSGIALILCASEDATRRADALCRSLTMPANEQKNVILFLLF